MMPNIWSGTLIDLIAILVGTLLGTLLMKKFQKKSTTLLELLAVIGLVGGVGMAQSTTNILIPLISLILSYFLSSFFISDSLANELTKNLNPISVVSKKDKVGREGLFLAIIISLVGPLAIVGPIENATLLTNNLLVIKSGMDFVTSIILASAFGYIIVLSAIPIGIVQGFIALVAFHLGDFVDTNFIQEITAIGGIVLLMVSLNILNIKNFPILKFLLAIFLSPLVYLCVITFFPQLVVGF